MRHIKFSEEEVRDSESFHFLCQEKFGFPNYYGKNMDAWIDCMDEFVNELTIIDFGNCVTLKKESPNLIKSILECSAFVNYRKLSRGEQPSLLISMWA